MQVLPKNDAMRKLLKHPNGIGFREKGPANWPSDSFTHRRIRDGDVTVVKETAAPEKKAAPKPVENKS